MNHYDVLEIDKKATISEIKKAYRQLSLKYHPDKSDLDKKEENEKKFREINDAYSILSDPKKKNDYDHSFDKHKKQNDIINQMKQQFQQFHQFAQFGIHIDMSKLPQHGQSSSQISFKMVNGKRIKETIIQKNGTTEIRTEEL
jgi:DnaJ-class molecular chaperone